MRKALAIVAALGFLVPAQVGAQQIQAAPPSVSFWRIVEDTLLERLIARAIDSNRDLRAVEARVREARAVRRESRLDLLPVVTASGAYSRQRLAAASFPGASGRLPDQDVWDAGLQLSWEVDVFGRLRRNLSARNALLASAEEDVRDVQALLAAEVAGAYFDLRGAQERLLVAERNAGNQRNTLALTQDRLELGRGNALDTERARAQLSSTLASVPAIEAEIAALRHRMGVLLGQPPGATIPELEAESCRSVLPADVRIANLDAVVRDRPDVRSVERQHAASRAFVGSAKADYLPRLSIGGVAGYTADAFGSLGNSGTPRYAIGPVLSWPLFDLGRVKTRVEAARAVESEAAARYEQSVLLAMEEAATALTSYERARARLTHLEEAAAASERATSLARARFEGGVTDFLEVLDAERRQLEAQDRLAAGRAEASARLVGVYRALRGRWPADAR